MGDTQFNAGCLIVSIFLNRCGLKLKTPDLELNLTQIHQSRNITTQYATEQERYQNELHSFELLTLHRM